MNKTKLVAFNGDAKLKTMLVKEIEIHRKADQIIKGTYGEEELGKWKGCAVGCSIHSLNIKLKKDFRTGDHSVYETQLGIPRQLAYLEDRIFENLPLEEALFWPTRFMKAIKPGSDLSNVVGKLMVWLLVGNEIKDKKNGIK